MGLESRMIVRVCVLAVVVLGIGLPAAAQDVPKGEVSGGYQFISVKSPGEDAENFPVGWYFDVAGNVTDAVAIVGQFSGNYKTIEDPIDGDFDLKIHPYMVGIRGSSRRNEKVVPFGQVLVGGVSLKASQGSLSASETDLAVQVGGGVNVMGNSKVGVRLGVDYLRVFGKSDGELTGGDDANVFRFVVGVVVPFGMR